MKENLYYLFISGLILGSGPCLAICAPILISYVASQRASIKESISSYAIFSLFKVSGYIILGILCALGVKLLNSPALGDYLNLIYLILGSFIVLVGSAIVFNKAKHTSKICQWLHKGNIKNVGVFGLLVGLAPCLPLLGILNYVLLISKNPAQAIIFTSVFGMGTVLSPLLILIIISAKISENLSKNQKFKTTIRIISGLVIIFFGLRILLK